jgi:hypothetical protein
MALAVALLLGTVGTGAAQVVYAGGFGFSGHGKHFHTHGFAGGF